MIWPMPRSSDTVRQNEKRDRITKTDKGRGVTGKTILAVIVGLALLAGCAERDVILSGERLDIRADQTAGFVNEARAISLPAAQVNAEWTHRNGGPTHAIPHPALGASLTQVMAVNIGEGDSRRFRITADPVVAGGRIFTLDAQSQVVATAPSGERLWSRVLGTPTDSLRSASGGGLASNGRIVIATTGFGRLVAMDAETGAELWTQRLNAPGTSAPTILGDLAYVVSRDGRGWAVELSNGRVRWTLSGTPPEANFAGGAGAAVTPEIAIFPFPSGEVLAAFPEGGLRRWSSVIAGQRAGQAASTISDIAGDPVIVGETVYVGNVAGRLAALNVANGDRQWTALDGPVGPVWPAGGRDLPKAASVARRPALPITAPSWPVGG